MVFSVQFTRSVVSNSLWPHGLQRARLPCSPPTPGECSNSWSNRWCRPTISSSVIPFSSCLQSFPASGSFQMSQFFTSGGLSIGVSASASVLPMNLQDWFLSLLFSMLSRLVIAFLSRNKHLLISWLQSPSAVILEPMQSMGLQRVGHDWATELIWVHVFVSSALNSSPWYTFVEGMNKLMKMYTSTPAKQL